MIVQVPDTPHFWHFLGGEMGGGASPHSGKEVLYIHSSYYVGTSVLM
jgi:hypothetical protein